MQPRSVSSRTLHHALTATLGVLASAAAALAMQTITATSDINGRPRPASAELTQPSTVRCVAATGQAGDGPDPSCQINAPGFSGKLEIRKQVAIEKPGYLTLSCNGNPPTRCSAQISP